MFTYKRGVSFFAEAETVNAEEEASGGGQSAESKGGPAKQQARTSDGKFAAPTQADLDALRSAKDKEIADVRSEASTVRQELDQLKQLIQGDVELKEIDQELQGIDFSDDTAANQVRNLAQRLVTNRRQLETIYLTDRQALAEQAASYRALQIAQDHGGDFDGYKSELLKAKNLDEMDLIRDRIDLRLSRENNGQRTTNSARRPDSGAGNAVRSSVADEIAAIDVNTPDGLKEWNAKRGELLKKAQATARTGG